MLDYSYLGVTNNIASSTSEALQLALDHTMRYPVILFIASNIISIYAIDQKPGTSYKYYIMFLNSIISMYLLNLMQITTIDSTNKQQQQTQQQTQQ